ncbi:MAG: methylated-DNA--[protein]-cysteine S-methyltransferase [Candidatus Nanopelagicales bacterium]|jgi:methylated-DNA-[protein]-cysteine S-methyltransferase
MTRRAGLARSWRYSPLRITSVRTPWRPIGIVADEEGIVIASWFGEPRESDVAHVDISTARKVRHIEGASDAVRDWVDGDVDAILDVPVDQPGGEFQQAAWQAMRHVTGGTTVSYADLARMSGNPKAVRAAGTACALNHVAPFVPCHRIIHTDGTISAYGFGADLKALLLEHEGALL